MFSRLVGACRALLAYGLAAWSCLAACGRTGLDPFAEPIDDASSGDSGSPIAGGVTNGGIAAGSVAVGGVATGGVAIGGSGAETGGSELAGAGTQGAGASGAGGQNATSAGAGGEGGAPCDPVACPPPWRQVGEPLAPSYMYAIAASPSVAGTVYAGNDSGGGVYRTTDSGLSWTSVSDGLSDGAVHSLAVDPFNAQSVWAGLRTGLYFSANAGAHWTKVDVGEADMPDPLVVSLDPSVQGRVYVALNTELQAPPPAKGALYKSEDGGRSWTRLQTPAFNRANSLNIDSSDSKHLFLGTLDVGVLESLDGSTFDTMRRLPDATFQVVYEPASKTLCALTFSGTERSTDGGLNWAGWPASQLLNITLAPGPVFYATGWPGVLRSTNCSDWTLVDGPESYRAVVDAAGAVYVSAQLTNSEGVRSSPDGVSPFTNVNSGVANADVHSVLIDPAAPDSLFVSASHQGIYHSKDRAESFVSASGDLGNAGSGLFPDTLQFDGSTLFGYSSQAGGPLFRSNNAGKNWSQALLQPSAHEYLWATALLPSPSFESDSLLYLGTRSVGISTIGFVQSTDGGASFSVPGQADFNTQLMIWDKSHAGWIWAVGSPAGSWFGSNDETLYLSQDTGETWTPVSLPLQGRYSVLDATITPAGEILYVSVDNQGLLRSEDEGGNWSLVSTPPGAAVTAFAIDPSDSSTLYLASGPDYRQTSLGERGLYKSRDGGVSWVHADRGIIPGVVQTLVFDPATPLVLYAGMASGGLYKTTTGGE